MARSSRQHRRAVEEFRDALIALAEISELRPLGYGFHPSLLPREGNSGEWFVAREQVERLVPAATLAFQAARVSITCKVPGTFTQVQRFDPAGGWSTVLNEHPYFPLGEVLACCARADGFFAGGLHRSAVRARRAERVWVYLLAHKPVLFGGLASTVAGGVIGGYFLYRLGWN